MRGARVLATPRDVSGAVVEGVVVVASARKHSSGGRSWGEGVLNPCKHGGCGRYVGCPPPACVASAWAVPCFSCMLEARHRIPKVRCRAALSLLLLLLLLLPLLPLLSCTLQLAVYRSLDRGAFDAPAAGQRSWPRHENRRWRRAPGIAALDKP